MKFHPLRPEQTQLILQSMAGVAKWDTSDGLCGIADIIQGGQGYIAERDGQPLMAFVIDKIERQNGRELIVKAARELASQGDLTETVLPEIERQFGAGCAAVTIVTKRPGLVKKLEKNGYREAAKIMRKKL